MSPEVSVIIPFFNAENTLFSAVSSILNQTFENFELLLVDNNSSDKSRAIAEKLADSDSRIKIHHEQEQGVEHAMNCGLKYAKANLVARMDADDFSLPERLAKQVAFLNPNNEDILVVLNESENEHYLELNFNDEKAYAFIPARSISTFIRRS